MQEQLRSRLLADGTVAALVGTRVDWSVRPQASLLPAITLQMISEPRPATMAGTMNTREARVQVDVWGKTYSDARLGARAVISALEPEATVGPVRFLRSFVDGDRDMPEDTELGVVFRVSVDLKVNHTVSA